MPCAISKTDTSQRWRDFVKNNPHPKLVFLKNNSEMNIAIAPFQKCCEEQAIAFVKSCELDTSFV